MLAFLSEVGYRNIEPYSFHGLTAEQFKALADRYRLAVPSRHMSTNEATWDANLADAKLLGQHWTGSGGFASPGNRLLREHAGDRADDETGSVSGR